LIVESSWLESNIDDTGLVLIDSRGKFAYNRGHLKNAVSLGLEDIMTIAENGANLTIEGSVAEDVFGRLGIDESKKVVVYGEYFDPAAARIVWSLNYNGHRNTGLLDKGFGTLRKDGLFPIDQLEYKSTAARFTFKPDNDLRADENFVKQKLDDEDTVIVDSRTEIEHIQARIHGSKLLEWVNGIGENGMTMKSSEQLLKEFTLAGISHDKSIICYCHSGTRASHKFLQFKHAGFTDVRCYDGSIIDWGQRKNPLQ
jgi:thiosulfate/3-mercaptopyruvate sulfurtransferase